MNTSHRFSDREIRHMRVLKRLGITQTRIADYFDTTSPTVRYHTSMINPVSPGRILDGFEFNEDIRFLVQESGWCTWINHRPGDIIPDKYKSVEDKALEDKYAALAAQALSEETIA